MEEVESKSDAACQIYLPPFETYWQKSTPRGLMTFGPCHGGLVILKLPVEFSNQAA